MLVRSDIEHEFVGAFEISEPHLWVGRGAGPEYAKGKYCMIVRVWLADGSVWKSGGMHATPSIRFTRRRKVVMEQVRKARRAMSHAVSGIGIRVGPGGDLNSPWATKAGQAVLDILRRAGLKFVPTGPTHDSGRRLDYHSYGGLARLRGHKLLKISNTDHRGLLSWFRRKEKKS